MIGSYPGGEEKESLSGRRNNVQKALGQSEASCSEEVKGAQDSSSGGGGSRRQLRRWRGADPAELHTLSKWFLRTKQKELTEVDKMEGCRKLIGLYICFPTYGTFCVLERVIF